MLDCSLLKTAMMIVNTCLKSLWSPFFVYKYTCLGALFRVAFALEVCELKRCIADYCNLVKEKCMSIVNGCLSSFPIETKYTMIQSNPKLHGALSVGFYLEHNRFNKNREIRSDRANRQWQIKHHQPEITPLPILSPSWRLQISNINITI